MDQYNHLFNESSSGYAIHKKVSESNGKYYDFEFIDINSKLENITGLNKSEVVGKNLSLILPRIKYVSFDWAGLYHGIKESGKNSIELFSEPLKKWFNVHVYSPNKECCITQFTDITGFKRQISEVEKEIQLFRNAINGANIGIFEWNVQTGQQIINERWADMIGYSIEELSPVSIETWRKITHPEDLVNAEKKIESCFSKESQHYSLEFRMKHKEGHWVWIESNCTVVVWTADGIPLLVSGSHLDITGRKITEIALMDNERRLAASQEIAHVGSWELNPDSKVMWASEEAFKIYGLAWTNGYILFEDVLSRVTPEYRQLIDDGLKKLIISDEKYDMEYKIINDATNKEIHIHSRAIVQKDESGKVLKIAGTIQDITKEKQREEELFYLGYHDQLTGLFNRRFFNEELLRLDQSENLPLAIALCDVNGLKLVNDSFGHDFGDEILKRVGKNILAGCRAGDVPARYGGDEFALILPKTKAAEAEKVIKEIKESITGERAGAVDISVSYGFKIKENVDEDIKSIIKNAENQMYKHKLYENKSARSKTVDLIINTLYEKNNREMNHSKRVSSLCEFLANQMGIGKDEVNKIKIAGLMHDIGKIGIDEKVLNTEKGLTPGEWAEIKKHPEIGYRILSSVSEFTEIAEFVLEHQEKWDGTGYPKGLKGEEISLEARIISICDAYDAMTRERTYREVLPKAEALAEIRRFAGIQFDPQLVQLFVKKLP